MIQAAADPPGVERYASPRSVADHLRLVRDRLHRRFDDTAGAGAVDAAVDEAVSRLDHARVETFVPVLVERTARAQLRRPRPTLAASGRPARPPLRAREPDLTRHHWSRRTGPKDQPDPATLTTGGRPTRPPLRAREPDLTRHWSRRSGSARDEVKGT